MADLVAESAKFESKLKTGRERFLAHVIEHALEIEQRSPADFIRHFSPATIMKGLGDQPELRAQMLVLTTGVKHKIAARKSAESAGEDLQIALDEGETDPEAIVAIFDPDDRVRFLDNVRLWTFCVEGEFWKASATNSAEMDRARRMVAFVMDRALADSLITHRDVVEAIGVTELATRLPRAELGKLIERALEAGHRKASFSEADLLATLPPSEIVRHVPLGHLWATVVSERIATRHAFMAPPASPVSFSDWPGADPAGAGTAGGGLAGGGLATSSPEGAAAARAQPKPSAEGDDEGPIIESLPPESDSGVEITDDDIRIS